ncbi:MAG: BON domain-containing protein [Acidobacteriota bacterium]|nr:BON domain-containing protein [Acidobacteriota bacterium]
MNKSLGMMALAGLLLLAVPILAHQDAPLERAVSDALLSLPHYGVFDNLAFAVNGPDVVLSGQVVLPITKDEAAKRVQRIKGIGKVVNSIEVLPLSPSDDAVRKNAYRALFGTSDLHKYSMGANPSIHIIVKGGHITLVGVVSSQSDADLALLSIRGVPGAQSQKSLLKIAK